MAIRYIGDMHFGHTAVIKFDNRPFLNIDEMDRCLIYNWNAVTSDNDEVIIDGDFTFKSSRNPEWYLSRLKGKKHLVIGNHDSVLLESKEARKYIESVDKMMHVNDNGRHICVCHFPIAEWNGMYKGHYHIYAHIHNHDTDTKAMMKMRENAFNCGCMINNYMPVTFEELVYNNRYNY